MSKRLKQKFPDDLNSEIGMLRVERIAIVKLGDRGVIDADKIAHAPAALKTLDKNGDGKFTQDKLRPARPPHNGVLESGKDKPHGPTPGDP